MASVVINGDTSGAVTITAPAVAGTPTLTLPTTTGTILTTASTAVVTQAMLSTNVVGNGPIFSAYQSGTQTVSINTNPRYYMLIETFRKKTNIPILLNTSFNENEPIVNTPEEALDCFLRTDMDMLVLENFIIRRQ